MTNLSVASRVVGLGVVVVEDDVPGLNTESGTRRVVGLRVVVFVVVPVLRTEACLLPETAEAFCEGGVVLGGTKTGAGCLVVNSTFGEPCEVTSLLLGKNGAGSLVVKFDGTSNRGVVGLGVEGTGNRGVVCA